MNDAMRQAFLRDGFCRFSGIVSKPMLVRLQNAANSLLDAQTPEEAARVRAQGSLFPATAAADSVLAELIALPEARAALSSLGYATPTYSDGYIISKPGHSPRLFWHYDWFAWEDAVSYGAEPPQVFFMYYLTDTRRENGCLRVIPGSHVHHNPLHDLLREPHSRELGAARDLSAQEFSDRPDEVDVPVCAGDLLVGDARLLHAAHANTTNERRTLITLWYQPDFAHLPERVQAQVAAKTQPLPDRWPSSARALVEPLLPRYFGDALPCGRTLYRAR